jgi:pyruvate/2-oxoglutarate dehydrogenase complex dihydrolipoamide dehydrogenase (E3) component
VKAESSGNGQVRLTLRSPEGERTITGSHLLLAAGRTPNTDRLNLAAAGVNQDGKGYITANDRLETNVPGIYVIGDVKGGPAFTHISYDDYRILCSNVIMGEAASIADRMVPYTVFTDPQLGRVGMSQREAEQQGRNIKVGKLPMGHIARAQEIEETRGFMKAIVDADTGQILGCAILGIEGGEIMAIIQVAMMGQLPYTALANGTFAHPTLAEALNNLVTYLE